MKNIVDMYYKMNKCDVCNFSTNVPSNLTRHYKSVKHIENVKKKEHRINARRENAKKKLEEKDADTKDSKDEVILELQKRLDNRDKEFIDLFKMHMEVMKSHADTSNKSMSAMKYLVKHRTTAPPIAPLKGRELTKMIEYKGNKHYKLTDIIVHNYKHKTMAGFLGDMIVDKYKTEEPEDQSVWMSDLARLSFIIRELKDGNPEWVKDKSGTKLTKLIISPLMKKVKEMLIERVNELDELNNESETDEMDTRNNVQTMQQINEIIRDINLSKFDGSILKHIAPEFNLDIK